MRTGISLFLLFVCSGAFALNNRSAVSITGNDANSCTPAAPCRSFNAAMAQTAAGGEIVALDSAGYGPFNISQSVTVSGAPGIHAAITATSGNAIVISAAMSDHVTLSNLVLIGSGGAAEGINSLTLGNLVVSGVTVTGFVNNAIHTDGTLGVLIDRCLITDNAPAFGVDVIGAKIIISNCLIARNNTGIAIRDSSSASITHSDLLSNSVGVISTSFTGGTIADAEVEACSIVGNGDGVTASTGGTGTCLIRISNDVVIGNISGVTVGGNGTVYTYGNNRIDGNTTDVNGLLTSLAQR